MEHYSLGYNTYTHKGKQITSIVGNANADKVFTESNFDSSTKPGIVPPGYKDRPDLMANVLYNSPKDFWLLCLTSNKYDVFEDFSAGERIRLPR